MKRAFSLAALVLLTSASAASEAASLLMIRPAGASDRTAGERPCSGRRGEDVQHRRPTGRGG